MADVFVSYEVLDEPFTAALVSTLQAEGWTVRRWDKDFIIDDDLRNEMMTELGRAGAVIVIWTPSSVRSEWVREVAQRALGDRKLISVRSFGVPPFVGLKAKHDNILLTEHDKIRAAVASALQRQALRLAKNERRRQEADRWSKKKELENRHYRPLAIRRPSGPSYLSVVRIERPQRKF
jgi:TIR domain